MRKFSHRIIAFLLTFILLFSSVFTYADDMIIDTNQIGTPDEIVLDDDIVADEDATDVGNEIDFSDSSSILIEEDDDSDSEEESKSTLDFDTFSNENNFENSLVCNNYNDEEVKNRMSVSIFRDEKWDDGYSVFLNEIDTEELVNFDFDSYDVILPFSLSVFDKENNKVDTGNVRVQFDCDITSDLENQLLLHSVNDTWEIISYSMCPVGETSIVEFETDSLTDFVFVKAREHMIEVGEEVDENVESTSSETESSVVDFDENDIVIENDTDAKIEEAETNIEENVNENTDSESTESVVSESDTDSETETTEETDVDKKNDDTSDESELPDSDIEASEDVDENKDEEVQETDENAEEENMENDITEDMSDSSSEDEISYLSGEIKYEDDDVVLVANVSEENQIPDTAVLVVSKIEEDDILYLDYMEQIKSLYGVEDVEIYPYDVHFEVEGVETEPKEGEIAISFTLKSAIEVSEEEIVNVVHITEDSIEEVAKDVADDEAVESFDFSVEEFSGIVIARMPLLGAPATDTENKYVFLYKNGDLVFQQGNATDDSKGEIVYQAVAHDGNIFDKNWDKTLVKRVYFNTTVKFNGGVGGLFYGYSNLEYVYNINNVDINGGTTLSSAFEDCSKLKHISGLADWDVTGIKSISYLFENCGVLDNINDIESWNLTLNSSGLGYAFYGCKFLQTLDLSGWDLSNITSLSATFAYSSYLESINLGNIFSNVTSDISLSDTFMYCYSLRDIGGLFDNASNAYLYRTFYDCRNLEEPIDFSGMNIRSLYHAFYDCYKLKGIDFTGCSFRSINMEGAFDYCYDLRYVNFTDITSSSSFGIMNYTFKSTKKLSYLDLSHSSFQSGGTDTFYNSGISKIKLGENWKFGNSILPSGNWKRESTGEIFTADELKQQWNSTMADTYEKVNVITFDGNGGTVSKSRFIKQLDEVMTEDDFPTATRDGYRFVGWFTEKEGGEPFDVGSPVTQSVYYAHWDENSYTLVLKRNVDDDPNDTESRVSLTYSEVYQLQPDLFTNEDKVIQGWTTNPDGTGTFYSADEKIIGLTGVEDGEFYLYAKWGRTHNATISFDSQGGDAVADIVRERGQILYKDEYVIPKRDDYTFLGWYTDPEAGTRWDNANRTIVGSQQLYAHWVKNPIINFVPNGGWISTFSKEVPYGGHLDSLPWGEDRIKKLMGFYTEQEQGQGEKLTTSKTFTEDATYYAHWGYQPTFNTAGGKYVTAFNVNTIYPINENNMLTITSLPEVTYDGYTLVRWKLGDGSTVNVGDTVDLSLYPEIIAEWEHTNTVKVTFDPNGGRLEQYYQGSSYLSQVYEMEKDTALSYYPGAYKYISNKRFDFLGWYDENDVLYTRDSIISEDITLYAKYKADSNIKYIFKVKDNNFRATGDSYNSADGYRITYVYKNVGDEFGEIPGLESPTGKKLNGIYLDGWYSMNVEDGEDDYPFEEDGFTLKQGAVKLTPDTVRNTDSTWYARIIDNKIDKFNDIISYKYYAEWVNASNQDVSNVDNNLSFHPQGYNEQVASLHLHFELDDAVSSNLPVGAVRIKVPKYIWKDWNGNNTGTVNLSTQLPQFPSIQSGMQFSYAEDDEYYIILNNQPISGGAGVDLTLSYAVNPLNVPGGAVDKNKDYVPGYDFYSGDVPVLFEVDRDITTTYEETTVSGNKVVTLTDNFEADTSEDINLSVEMHTFVEPGIAKTYQKIYYEWQSDWGTRPDDADDYFYIYWQTSAVSKNNQPYTYTISEDTIHDGTVVTGNVSGPYTVNYGNTYSWNYLYTVTKHPKSLLDPIPSTGLKITNQSRYTVVQKSGYTQEVVSEATYTMYKWEYTKGEFDKTNLPGVRNNYSNHGFKYQSSSVQTCSGGQDQILGNQDLTLEWELHYDGVSRDTPIEWDEESQTYRRDQRVISFTDGINNDFMYSSGEPYSKYVWEPSTGNYILSDRDYTITKLRIFVNEYDGSYHNGEWGGPTLRSDYGLWKDIDIYLRYKDTDDLVFWKSVRPWATGKYYVGTSNQYGYTDVSLPNNVVGWEIRYPTKYYSTYLQVNELVTLHSTADVKSYIMSDVAKGVYSEIKNRAYCNIWTSDNEMEDPDTWDVRYYLSNFTEDTWEEPDIFFHVTNWKGGLNGANKEIWELTKSQSSMYARKYAAGHDRVLFDVERGVQDDPMAIVGWNYNNSTFTPIKTGRFYDLLPKGATVDKSTIFAVLSQNNSTSYNTNVANSYIEKRDNPSSHLGKEYYNVEFVENWEDSGRTMMIIDYTAPTNTTNCAVFYYLLHMTYQDVVSYGTSVRNDIAFIDTTKDNVYSYATAAQSILEDDSYLYDTINITNDYVSYGAAQTDYIPVDAFSWGFYKSVNTQNGYVSSDITIPNNLYTYKINYSQSDYAVSDSIVFFDVLEAGGFELVKDDETGQPIPDPITGENVYRKIKDSAWTGTFESIDVDAIKHIAKEGTDDIFCKPVIYYSTKPKDSFTGSDYNVNKTETWTTEMPANKADITAIAVDCTKATDGSDFRMFGRQSVPIYVTMRAPTDEEYIDTTAVNQAMFFGKINNEDSSSTSDTEVTLTEEEPEIHKTSNPETGTLESPTIISSGDNLTYTITVTNKNEEFTVPDFVVEDTVPDGVQVDTSNINVHFGDVANSLPISISPRASLTVRGTKLVFTINSLSPEETCYLIIPCKAKASGGQVLINTSKITKVNGVDKEIDSETTYHKVEFDIIFSKQSDQHKLVIGSTLQLWDTDLDELVEEWVTGTSNKKIRLHTGHYVLKEIEVPDGYAIADDIVFEIQDDGTVKFEDNSVDTKVVMIDVASTSVKGAKTWKFDEDSDRPSSITVKLMRKTENDAEPVYSGKSIVTSAADNWEYDFGLVQKYDTEGNEYTYSVVEEPVTGYTAYYTNDKATNGLALMFNSRTGTYNSYDKFTIYYNYRGKIFGKTFYGKSTYCPAGQTINIPASEFWIAFETDGSNNEYGFKFDQIVPVLMDDSQPVFSRYNPSEWMLEATAEEYAGSKYPETDHDYFVYEKVLMHYTRDMEGDVLDIVNSKNSTGFDIKFDKISERGEKLGGVVMQLTSDPEVGDAVIDPIEWTTVANQSKVIRLEPGHYILHEKTAIANYQYADDIRFLVDENGKVIIDNEEYDKVEMIDMDAINKYPFKKIWVDDGFEDLRPESLTFNLVRVSDDEIVATKSLTAADATDDSTWEGWFDDVPIIDEEWNPIEYVVREVMPSSDYRVYHDVQNKTGFYVTFTEDSDLGSGKLYIYPGGVPNENQPHNYLGKFALMLNPEYNMAYAEGTDMAGKTYFVPIVDNVESFIIRREWASDSVKLEIESIVPAFDDVSYETAGSSGYEFTNIFNGKNYPNLNEDGVSIATYQWVPQLDSEDGIVLTDEVANYVNKTDIPFVKYWDNENDDPSGRPETLTFDLYNVLDMSNVVQSITVDVDNAVNMSEYVFENVPKYNEDWTVANYVVREQAVDGYRTFYTPNEIKGLLVTFSDDSTAGSGNMYLYGKNNNYMSGPSPFIDYRNGSNYTYVTGSSMAGKTYYVPVLDSSNPGFVLYVTGDSSKTAKLDVVSVVPVDYAMSVQATADGMPVRYINAFFEGDNYPYIHSNETDATYYYASYDYDVEKMDIHNVKDETSIPVTKIWTEDTPEDRPESITVQAINERTPDVVAGSVTMSVSDATDTNTWESVITGLPKYNADGTEAVYILKEVPVEGYLTKYRKPTGMLITFSEDSFAGTNGSTDYIALYSVSRKAAYSIAQIGQLIDGSTTYSLYGKAITGKTYFVPIIDDGDYSFCVYKSNSNSVVKIEHVELTYTTPTYYTSSTNSSFGTVTWHEGTGNWDLTGQSGYSYYTYNGIEGQFQNGGASFDNIITNERNVTNIPFTKNWVDSGYEADRPASVRFGLFNKRDEETAVAEITLNRSEVEEGNVWTGTFENVPKYNADGSVAVYVIKELDTLSDYESTPSVSGIKGFLLKFSDDTDLYNGGMYIWQSDGYQCRNYVAPRFNGYGSSYWYGSAGTPWSPAGKTIYVPVLRDGVYEFMIQLYRNSSSYTNVHYEIESITPVYEEIVANNIYTGSSLMMNYDYNYYQLVENVSSLSKDFSSFGTSTNYLYTLVRWNVDTDYENGIINKRKVYPVRFNKYSDGYPNVSGATLQILNKADNSVVTEWETNDYDYEYSLIPGTYILHESVPPVGFEQAEDIEFIVTNTGTVTVNGSTVTKVRMKDKELVTVKGTKTWLEDTVDQRPESIVVNLYRNDTKIDSQTITADDEWKYSFNDLQKYDENGVLYTYTVNENPVYDYAEAESDPVTTGSWLDGKENWEQPNMEVEHIVDTSEMEVAAYEFVFSSNSQTESTSYDWIDIYYRKNGSIYKMSERLGGSLSNRHIIVPSNDVYFYWRTDYSVTYWGWKIIDAIPLATSSGAGSSYSSSFPTSDTIQSTTYYWSNYTPIEYSGTNYPETVHSYGNYEHKIYHWTGPAVAVIGRDDYTVTATGLKVTFDNYSQTETGDKLVIYFYAGGEWFKYPTELSGDLRGRQITIPSRRFYIHWQSNSSNRMAGWKIKSIEDAGTITQEGLKPATGLPNLSPMAYSGDDYPSRLNYGNNESMLFEYIADGLILPDDDERYSSYITANIQNTRLPDKQDYSVYKKNTSDDIIGGAVLEITGREKNATYDIIPIRWTSVADEAEVVQLREGDYVLHEVTPPTGYIRAADIGFKINSSGELIVGDEVVDALYMTDTPNKQRIPVAKSWDDAGFSQYRPASITFDLYDKDDMDTVVDSLTVTADDNWAGAFEDVPYVKGDSETPIEYTVVERDVQYYNKEITTDTTVLDAGTSEQDVQRNFVFTPNYGLKMNMSSIASCGSGGPLLVIWKDRITGKWFSSGYGFGGNTIVTLSANEAYLLYRSYSSSYAGIDIDSVEPAVNCRSWSLTSGYEWNDEDINDVLPKAIQKYQGTSTYYPTDLTASDFVDGSDGYHDSCVGKDYNASVVLQLVHVVRPSSESVISTVPTPSEIANCEGFRITLGDDFGSVYGPMPLVYKTSDGRYVSAYLSSVSHNNALTFTIKSKEFYLCYVENSSGHTPGAVVVDGNSYSVYGTGHSVASIEPVSNVDWTFSATSGNYNTLADALYGYSTSFPTEYDIIDGRLGASLRDTRQPQVYSFDYSSSSPSYTYNDYFAEHGEFVGGAVTAKNTFNLHPYDVPFAKKDEDGNLLGGAHLQLFNASTNTLVNEWDTSSTAVHTETLDYGSYVLKETSIPAGYVKSADIAFTLTPIGEILIGATAVESVDMTDNDTVVQILKQTDTGVGLAGATLQVLDSNNELKTQWVSSTTAHEIRNLPAGTYTLHEVSSPDGYLASDDITFVISDQDGSVKVNDVLSVPVCMTDTTIRVTIKKLDENNNPLSGVKLGIYSGDDLVAEHVMDGTDWVYGPIPVGDYILREISTISGYTFGEDIPFTINSDGTTTLNHSVVSSVDFSNTPTVVEIRKTDGISMIGDAVLQIKKADGTLVLDNITSVEGEAIVLTGELDINTQYIIHEKTTPTGYATAKDIAFTIDSEGNVLVNNANVNYIEMIDSPLYELTVQKTVTGNMGSKDLVFDFEVEFTFPEHVDTIRNIAYQKTVSGQTTTGRIGITNNKISFTLAHGDSIVFKELPKGTLYTVTEDEDAANEKGYTVLSTNATGAMINNVSVSFVNDFALTVPTVVHTNIWYMILLSIISLFIIGFIVYKRKKNII